MNIEKGKKVRFFPVGYEGVSVSDDEGLVSVIAKVNSDGTINLMAIGEDGTPHGGFRNIVLKMSQNEPPYDKSYALPW